ncbi:smoothelin-like protein 1 isoform X2 [Mixophyes fleayi]
MVEEQPPLLTEQHLEELSTSPQDSEDTCESTVNEMEVGIKDCHTTEKTPVSVCKTEYDITQDVGDVSVDHEAVKTGDQIVVTGKETSKDESEETKIGKDPIKSTGEMMESGDTVKSQGQVTEREGKIVSGENEAITSNQEKVVEDSSNHNTEETHGEESANAQIVCTGVDDEVKEEQHQLRATEIAEDVNGGSSAPTASAVKEDITPTSSKEATREKQHHERKAELPQARTVPKSYGRATKKDIAEKFGGVATSGIRVQRSTSCGAGAVKNMLLEWCRAKTRGREGVDIQNFSSSWSNGLAFCALIVAFFPDAFDYDSLDPKNRRQNFQLAFSTAE